MFEHSRFIQQQKKIYREIECIVCPALNGEKVYFNNKGFTHLLKKRGIFRPPHEQRKRMLLLPLCKDILEDMSAEISLTKNTSSHSNSRFWSIQKKVGQTRIKIVLRQKMDVAGFIFSVFILTKQKLPSREVICRLAINCVLYKGPIAPQAMPIL